MQEQATKRATRPWAVVLALIVLAAGGFFFLRENGSRSAVEKGENGQSAQNGRQGAFFPTPAQWASLKVEPVETREFRQERATEGKIAVDEDLTTPIFSPYSGRVTKLTAKTGEEITAGQPVFVLDATDMVQAQNDHIAALAALSKARAQLSLTQTVEKRQHELFEGKAAALKDWQQAQTDLKNAENDVRSSETALEATRHRLRILGKTDAEIATLEATRTISPKTQIYAPIGGTIVQRKVGRGQYISAGASDPVLVVGDLSSVWLIANVRETEAALAKLGQDVRFTVLAYPDRVYTAKLNYVASALDPTTRRLVVRATVPNPDLLLKPEMFASVVILGEQQEKSPAVPRSAVIYEGELARVWVVRDDKAVELRRIKTGLTDGGLIQVVEGLKAGDKVITKGSLFIDRIAAEE